MNIPEGYVLVPVELTQEMIQAGIDTECVDTGDEDFDEKQDYRAVYKSFLESAPQFPEYDEAKERELFEAWIPSFWNKRKHLDEDGDWIYADDLTQGALIGWLECAKSRARSAE